MAERAAGDPDDTTTSGPPTVHPDADHPLTGAATGPAAAGPAATGTAATGPARRRDPLLLVAGVVALAVAVLAVAGPGVLAAFDPRWVLATAALVVGVAVLATTVRRRR